MREFTMAIIWLSVGIAVGYFGKDKISAAYAWVEAKLGGAA
jgi:hypothetical protein